MKNMIVGNRSARLCPQAVFIDAGTFQHIL